MTESHGSEKQQYMMYKIGSEKKIVRLSCLEVLEIERQLGHLLLNEGNEQGRGGVVQISALRKHT